MLSIFRVEWTWPTQIFIMAQSLDASVSILMSVGLVAKSFAVAEYVLVSFCMSVLNSFGWNSFLTSCPLLPLLRITIVCTEPFHSVGILFVGQPDLTATVN